MVAYLLLGTAQILGLLLLPITALGIWLQFGSLAAFAAWADFDAVGMIPLAILFALALLAEAAWWLLVGRRLERSVRRRGMVVAAGGGLVGVAAGLAIPLVGSLFCAFVGSLIGGLAGVWKPAPEENQPSRSSRAFAFAFRSTAAFAIALVALATLTS